MSETPKIFMPDTHPFKLEILGDISDLIDMIKMRISKIPDDVPEKEIIKGYLDGIDGYLAVIWAEIEKEIK